MDGMASAVEFRDVTFQHLSGRTVLSGVSFTVREGESFALIGRSGSGKTTILKLINRLLDPTGGDVLVDGKSTRRSAPRSRASIVTAPDDLPLVPTTWTASYARCGSPSPRSSGPIRSRANPSSGHGRRPATQA